MFGISRTRLKIFAMLAILMAIAWLTSPIKLPFYFAGALPAAAVYVGSMAGTITASSAKTSPLRARSYINPDKLFPYLAIMLLAEVLIGACVAGLFYFEASRNNTVYLSLVALILTWLTVMTLGTTFIMFVYANRRERN